MDKVLGMIGLAKRAGKIASGEFMCDKAIKMKWNIFNTQPPKNSENFREAKSE